VYCVVGSGPASISAAMALVKRGLRVTMLDGGKALEPERKSVLDRLGGQKPDSWSAADLDRLRGDDQSSRHGSIHSKRTYGSEYPYEDVAEPLIADRDHAPFHYSMARYGGVADQRG
jgi:choline dehydrogenase-like flavoprotein